MVVDAGLGALFVVLVAIEVARQPVAGGSLALLVVLTLVIAVGLALRRRMPLTGLSIATAALVVEAFLHIATALTPARHPDQHVLGRPVRHPDPRSMGDCCCRRWGCGYFAGATGLRGTDPLQLVSTLFTWLAGWTIGYATARQRQDHERARRAIERQVIAEERVRMSRELHDWWDTPSTCSSSRPAPRE
jgi:signal transduction histidine kinase